MTQKEVLTYLQSHKQEFQENFGVIKIGLFGSYARNEQTNESDIDLAIEIEKTKKSLKTFFAIKRSIENDLKRKVDLGIESSLKPTVKEYIQKDIIYV